MAYDRYDRDERSRWSENRSGDRSDDRSRRDFRGEHRGSDDRGFWDRASDEVSSWFGDEDAERRRREDRMHDERDGGDREHSALGRGWGDSGRDSGRDYDRGYGRGYDRDRGRFRERERSRDRGRDENYDRGLFNRGGSSERDYNRGWQGDLSENRNRSSERDYRPMAGDYGRSSDHESDRDHGPYDRSQSPYGRDEYRRTSFAGSRADSRDERERMQRSDNREGRSGGDFDPHYHSWRDRHMSELDRDYDDYRRENQSRFESDFGSWREKRQHKRGLLGQVREHMKVVGSDDKHIGTVDKVSGDRIILAKSDPESGGAHHSLSCSDVDRVEGDRVILDCKADEAKNRWRDESRGRALFERDDQGEMGPRNLDRSFSGTYR